jgi:hypothetical protein
MRTGLAAACAVAAAACAGQATEPASLVDNPVYSASGAPGWHVEIGDDIVLRLDHHHFGTDVAWVDYRSRSRWPPRTWNGIRRWRTESIMVEARPGPCTTAGGTVYEDHVRVVTRQRRLEGCGGRVLTPDDSG